MVCHYCDYQCPPPKECPECHSPYIRPFGIGTQKVEEFLSETYPSMRVARMDADTTGGKLSHNKILSSFSKKEVDVLLGTQMIAKGLDFPDVTLVGVLAADLSLHIDDYRSRERTFQLLTQVCGRSGRGSSSGKAIIQTYCPEDETIGFVKNQDYLGFYESELALRRMLSLPPFAQFALIQITAGDEKKGQNTLDEWLKALDLVVNRGEISKENCLVMASGKSPISRIGDKHRFRILMKTQNLNKTQKMLQRLYGVYLKRKAPSEQIVTIDCKPNSIL
ncbi:MAG: primosomal protein N', partial [Clostridia bacterium]|nr:primosomal protein N' [Clostridia bacterium]